MSQRYLGLPSLRDVLRHFAEITGKPYADESRSAEPDLALVATNVAQAFHEMWRTSDAYASGRTADGAHFIDSESPLKIEVARLIRERDGTEPGDPVLRAELTALKHNFVDGVITTGWDSLLERTFPGFQGYVGQNAAIRADLMVAPATQQVIGDFGKDKYGQQLFVPHAGKSESDVGL